MSAWGEAVDALRELNDVFVVGACREEEFDPSLVRRGAVMVNPRLDEATAMRIAGQVAVSGLPAAMDPGEAWARSDGLLMEFIALLTRAKRLEQVLAEQAAGLRQPGRELQRAAARLVTAAHSIGLALTVNQLDRALAATGASTDAVGDALVSCARNPLKICVESFEDLVGGLGPGEGAWVLVPDGDPGADVFLEGLQVLVHAAA